MPQPENRVSDTRDTTGQKPPMAKESTESGLTFSVEKDDQEQMKATSLTAERLLEDEDLDDYDRLVKGLNLKVADVLNLFQDDDEDEYNIMDEIDDEEQEEEDDDDNVENGVEEHSSKLIADAKLDPSFGNSVEGTQATCMSSVSHDSSEDALYRELAEELGWLEEEDIEAAVASLLDHGSSGDGTSVTELSPLRDSKGEGSDTGSKGKRQTGGYILGQRSGAASFPFKHKSVVSNDQYKQISLMLQQHYQLLVQQAVLTVRAAHYQKYHRSRTDRTDFLAGGETADDLVEILDAAVGLLHDLRQNQTDAIRFSLQFNSWKGHKLRRPSRRGSRAKDGNIILKDTTGAEPWKIRDPTLEMRLTRSKFQRKLAEQGIHERVGNTVFDIGGLLKLDDTFALIDRSVQHDENNDQPQLLEIESNKEACEYVLNATQQSFDASLLPGNRDVSENLSDPQEFLGLNFKPPCNEKQQSACRRNRNLFTAGEDNLVLRGVNLYGEKQWMLIADRFLPERSTNIISQRYSKLCVLMYKANGILIDSEGRLEKPPKHESSDDIDETSMSRLKPVPAPAVLNVHRWSLEEDLTLLKAVPITGHMWAELGSRLIPHRDRGHLRKRYQVLERRVKSTVERSNKREYLKSLEESAVRAPTVPDNTKSISVQQKLETRPPTHESTHSHTPTVKSQPSVKTGRTKPVESVPEVKAGVSEADANVSSSATAHIPPPHMYSPHHPPHPFPYPYPMYGSPSHLYPPPYPYPHHPPYSPYVHIPPPHYNDTYPAEDESRAAFEKLAREGSPEDPTGPTGWSQMSQQMQELMKTENMVASAMAVDLARSPSKLEADKRKKEIGSTEHANDSAGLLAGILRKTKETDVSNETVSKASDGKPNHAKQSQSETDPMPVDEKATRSVHQLTRNVDDAVETKDQGTTPARDPTKGAIFSTDGTQIGLSPAFQASPAQLWPKIPSPALGNISVASFPPTSQMVGFSPSPHSSPQTEITPPAHSLDTVAMQHLAHSGQSVNSRRKVLFKDGHVPSTLSENDLEAISGLNLMASSPGLPSSSASSATSKRKNPDVEGRSSLFAKVVGDQEKDPKKRKLVF